ncbi:hypothetical protein [Arthrobacter sp. ok909]|uniref:hypothetical protein n=1 Tax=Arthrobacter sp. ok909 TaxID=1761746 RepID=UPI0011132E4D|nr:hypothetical protein [Arthrobacter sp. ok909]
MRPVLEIDLRQFTKPGDKIPNYAALSRKLSGFDLPGGTAINLRVYGYEVFEENLVDWIRPDLHIQPCSADWANAMEWTRAIYRLQRGEAA